MSHPLTITEARTQARRYARKSSTAASDTQVNFLMDAAIDDFAVDVGGLPKEVDIAIAAKFTTTTNMAVRITVVGGTGEMSATDVLITGTARTETTGTIVAADFQTTLRAAVGTNMTVTWSNFYFTIDTLDATSITFEAPSTVTYVDARDLLGLPATPTLTDYSFTGNFPQDCTMEASLPTTALTIEQVEWDNNKLYPVPREMVVSPEVTGTPMYYNVRGQDIRLYPTPTEQKRFRVEYRGMPATLNEVFQGYQELGLSSITGGTATGLAATTQYYYKIAIDGKAVAEYNITTASNLNWNSIITLMNAQNTGATWAVIDGDIRCTSDLVTEGSAIALSAGTTGTDLFATLTGFSAFETAVAQSVDLPSEIPPGYHQAVVYLTASKLLLESHQAMADKFFQYYLKMVRRYKVDYHGRDTKIVLGVSPTRIPKVEM